jgi:hypothetical protein
VTVVVVPPAADRRHGGPAAPQPSTEQLDALCAHLAGHRLVTTELFVKGPAYVTVRVRATLSVDPTRASGTLSAEAGAAVDAYLDPLARGTPGAIRPPNAGVGWPFGHPLAPTTLYAVLLGVSGVQAVVALDVFVDGREQPRDELIALPPDGLFCGGAHEITIRYPDV